MDDEPCKIKYGKGKPWIRLLTLSSVGGKYNVTFSRYSPSTHWWLRYDNDVYVPNPVLDVDQEDERQFYSCGWGSDRIKKLVVGLNGLIKMQWRNVQDDPEEWIDVLEWVTHDDVEPLFE
jgi:hypothetical protein